MYNIYLATDTEAFLGRVGVSSGSFAIHANAKNLI
jgi:hypothetical protein